MDERTQYINHIVRLNEEVQRGNMVLDGPQDDSTASWLSIPLTMPQFKTLLLIAQAGPSGTTTSVIARKIEVGLSTVSGIVDRMYEHNLLTRREDVQDRRITRIVITEKGIDVIESFFTVGRAHWFKLLQHLDLPSLHIVEQAFQLLLQASQREATEEQQ